MSGIKIPTQPSLGTYEASGQFRVMPGGQITEDCQQIGVLASWLNHNRREALRSELNQMRPMQHLLERAYHELEWKSLDDATLLGDIAGALREIGLRVGDAPDAVEP